MRKIWLFAALACMLTSSAFASPEGEIWKYTLKTRNGFGVILYAFRDGGTYLGQCENYAEPVECMYYKMPCALYNNGIVCAAYLDWLNYAIGFQCINGTCGMMHSFFNINLAFEFTSIYYVIPFVPFIFQLEMVGDFSEVPEENISSSIPDDLNMFEVDSTITIK
jgi:hypothetical protein